MGDRDGWVGKSVCCPSMRTRVQIPISHVKVRSNLMCLYSQQFYSETGDRDVRIQGSRQAPSLAYTTVNKRSYPKQGERWVSTIQNVFCPACVQLYLYIWTQGHAFHTIIQKDKKVPYEQYSICCVMTKALGHIQGEIILVNAQHTLQYSWLWYGSLTWPEVDCPYWQISLYLVLS